MKKQRKSRNLNMELYKKLEETSAGYRDTRYWGVFNGKEKEQIKIDVKRYQKKLGEFSSGQLKIINSRNWHYFYPKKVYYNEYNCNVFVDEIKEIKKYWENHFKPIIKDSYNRIKKPSKLCPGDYDNLQCGISGPGAAQAWADYMNWKNASEYREECAVLTFSLYSEFFHFMAARIEAITVKVLTQNNAIKDRFDRNVFYATTIGKNKKIEELDNFQWYDKLYCLWNFIKHNSISTYQTLKDRFPNCLYEDEYKQGEMALYFIRFNDEMIEEIIKGCIEFFKEYCELVFGENYEEAQWNYCKYFTVRMKDEIEMLENPLGLQWWDELD
ncbi:MAG: hypothetical protein IKL82_06650 [Clostridia bacterium]|nr:hypothetical protein [Clostridia bacterium]